ncbi:unnamed protein product [Schistocephalus solidus]|uniref:Uncharacterized protein n=1 Tax=Schistocephalus solidus TaxID=70667 RepID=A0A183TBS6_SCHSO|nr:unnamed protein product [Schistocephalus solidus]
MACPTHPNSSIRRGNKQGRLKESSVSGAVSLEGQEGSTTAPPSSLTLDVSGREWRMDRGPRHATAIFSDLDGWSVKRGWVKPMRETVVGFLGLTTSLARRTADLINRALGMPILYHQRYPLSDCKHEFCVDLKDLLRRSDVVTLLEDPQNQRVSWTKLNKRRSFCNASLSLRSRLQLQDSDFNFFKPSAVLICTTSGQSFRFDALAEALRCHKLAAAALTVPHTLSIAEDSLSQLHPLRNVLIVPPASAAASTSTRCLRFHLVNMIIHQLSRSLKIKLRCNLKGLEGSGPLGVTPEDVAAPQSSRYLDSLLETTRVRVRRSLRQALSNLSRSLPRELRPHLRPHSRQMEATAATGVERDDTWEAVNSELRTEIGELGDMGAS